TLLPVARSDGESTGCGITRAPLASRQKKTLTSLMPRRVQPLRFGAVESRLDQQLNLFLRKLWPLSFRHEFHLTTHRYYLATQRGTHPGRKGAMIAARCWKLIEQDRNVVVTRWLQSLDVDAPTFFFGKFPTRSLRFKEGSDVV